MSSTISDGSVHRGKLLIHIAENGHSLVLDCDGSCVVDAVQRFVEVTAGVRISDQLLLCSDMKLESHEPLLAYKLPSEDQEVFCFNKSRLQANAPPPQPEQVQIVDIEEPPAPLSSNNPHPLDDAVDPALKALPSYERQFRYHYQCGDAIYRRAVLKYENCQKLLREQKVQERALEIARHNLHYFFRILNQNYMDFLKCCSQQNRVHSDLLAHFRRDVDKLRSCKLIPALQTSSRKCLLDLVKEDNLQTLAENCKNSHKQFNNKVSQFKDAFRRLKQDVEGLFSVKTALPIKDLESMMREHQRYIDELRSIMQSLSKDVSTVKNLVDDCVAFQLSSLLRPHDAVSALGPMYDVHEKNHLPTMRACDHAISHLLDCCGNKKIEMNNFVHNYMQKIAYIQHFMKDVRLQFNAFSEAIKRQDAQFERLRVVHRLGPAYRSCFAEVVRRKASMKLYMGTAGHLAETLASKREREVRRREEFLKAQSPYIPEDILASMGLLETPSQCDVNIAPFDMSLLDIDIADIDSHAPEYLVGLPFMSEKQGSPRSSLSLSINGSHSEIVVDDVDAPKNYESEELLESTEVVEISGTSKMEVENAKLKAELASAIAIICSFSPEIEYESLDDSELDNVLKEAAMKTAEALRLKDEYVKHLQSELREKERQCESYKNRILELEQKLSDQFMQMQGHKFFSSSYLTSSEKAEDCKSEISALGESYSTCVSSEPKRVLELEQKLSDQFMQGHKFFSSSYLTSSENAEDCKSEISALGESYSTCVSSEPMDEVSFTSSFVSTGPGPQEEVDENMADSSGIMNTQVDLSTMEHQHEELQDGGKDEIDKWVRNIGTMMIINESISSMSSESAMEHIIDSKVHETIVLGLQSALEDKKNQLAETESRLKSAMEEVARLGRELETIRECLNQSQMNCAYLENVLHETRQEAQTHQSSADRRALVYSALRASSLKIRSHFERFRPCVDSGGALAVFVDSLHCLSQSLANSVNGNEDDGTAEFRACIKILADKVAILSRQHADLHDNKLVEKKLEESDTAVQSWYNKQQLEKQTNKEKISFYCFEVDEIAAFVLNSAGHYEAISRRSSCNYYLSAECVALFTGNLPSKPAYIIGQIVCIEQQQVVRPWRRLLELNRGLEIDNLTTNHNLATNHRRSASNPYGLPIGCKYFVVTIAMLPDTTIHPPSPS